ncbi:MAG: histidine kinase [Pseudopedobacter saltans]|uniref:Histidine kinase n=1 Tax=Pseudopedobacter saltans TaxID=151895 RepID=A0A2W5EMS9_9SPHI|nr:MAG: histidine kinase [Pseudopedobacter saltans]
MKNKVDIQITGKISFSKHLALWVLAMCLSTIFSYLVAPDDPYWVEYRKHSAGEIVRDIIINFLMCGIVAEISLWINNVLNRKLAWTSKPRLRLFLQATLNVVSCAIFIVFVYYMTIQIAGEKYRISTRKELIGCIQWLLTTTIVSLFISGINTINYLLSNWKTALLETTELKLKAAQLKEATMEAELQALKLQIDPHFIFNNLSVLSELILEDPQLGHDYVEHFAKVYRYLLVNSTKNLITIGEEVQFLESYVFLLKKRFGNGIDIQINLENEIFNQNIPPFTLQLLVENAIKHNQTPKSQPLIIQIYQENKETIVVKNTINPLLSGFESTGIGLKNIEARFSYLLNHLPETIKTEDFYIVKIPIKST